ncbi:ABC transporter substrate-binding protein [Hyphomicrobiales bacterium]|nr:ABC transporter substrate-binding protein [Hyphomicrobiales bacterium]CAH1698884.1 ABC transporter substrate-binding protein [Hyphomicrobiales bacterium]CAI0342528.1 peptide/nickel transport system substrate-binding protein [Hyphomicrobiales bacterium]
MKRGLMALAGAFAVLMAQAADAQTLRWSAPGDVVSFDPNAQLDSFTQNIQLMVYDTLVRRNRKLEIEPGLAASWQVVEPTRWRFKLRPGVKFHDGEAFTADDVVTTVMRTIDPDSRNKGNLATVVKAEKVDDMTVDLVLSGPYPLLLNDLTGIFVMSKGWLEKNNALKPGNTSTGVTTFASTHANGTGPFKLESYAPDSKTVMTVNEGWWDKPEHNLKRIEFRPIKSDATRVAALLSGEIDMISSLPLQDVPRVSGTQGFKVVEDPSLRLIFLGFNWKSELYADPGKKNPLLDPKVRQALWHAVDLDAIQKRIMRGKSRNTGTMVAPPVPGYVAEIDKPLAFDLAQSKKLLTEAGYPNGFKTGLTCTNDRYIADEQLCLAIAGMWTKAGIQVDVKTESKATYFPRQDRGELDVWMLGWATLPQMDGFSVLSGIFASRKDGFGGSNAGGMVVPALDDLARKTAVELDETKRRALMGEAFKIAKDQALFIPLHQQPLAWAMKTNVDMPQFPDEYVRPWFAKVN